MGINLDGEAVRVTGEPVMVPGSDGNPRKGLWKDLVVQVLSTRLKGDEALSFVEQNYLGRLARVIQRGGSLTLKAETVAKLKKRIGETTYPSDIVLSLCELLDPGETESKDEF